MIAVGLSREPIDVGDVFRSLQGAMVDSGVELCRGAQRLRHLASIRTAPNA